MFFILVAATYTLHLLQNQSIQHDDLYTTRHIYQTMKKHVTLADGRQVLCNIPVFKEQFDFKTKVVTNLTRDQVSQLLYPLENMCVHHRTFEFLYEYCFRKYVRQFDDQQTKLNLNKILIEDFSLGFEQDYNNLTNKSTNLKHPLQHSYNIDSIINNIPHKSYVLIDGCIAKIRGEFKLDPSDQISRMIELEFQQKTYKFHIQNIFNSYFAILEDCSDEILISSKVIYHQSNLAYQKFDDVLIYNTRNIIFSQKFRAQHQFQVNQTLGIIFYENIHLVKVSKIHDYGVIEVTGLKYLQTRNKRQVPQIVRNLIILDGQDQYQITNYNIWISNQVLFFDFREILDVGDQIVLYDDQQISFAYNFRIIKMFKDQIAILDKQFTQNLSYYGKAIIRKSSFIQDQQLYKQDYEQHLSNLTVYKLDKLDQDYQFYITGNGYFSGFTFKLVNVLSQPKKKLEIVIKSKKYTDLSIIFLQTPVEMIYLVNSKGHADMEPRFRNNTIFKGQFWVVIDTLDDVIYFGKGRQINLKNRMLYLKLQRVSDIEEKFTIVIKQSSQGLKLLDLTELPLTNYINMNYSDQLKGYFHALNYSLKLEAVYSERYNNGTLCEPVNRGRRSQVNFQCDHDNLMIFKSITEPAVCDYEITIGTYLLCENQRNVSIPEDKHIMCVLQ